MFNRFCQLVFLISLALLTLNTPELQAQTSRTLRLYGRVEYNSSVKLYWTRSSPADTNKFFVYRAKYPDTTAASYAVIDSTRDTTYFDLPSIAINVNSIYFYIVKTKSVSNTVVQSNYMFVVLPGIPLVGAFHLSVSLMPNNLVQLRWTKPPIAATKYYVYRAADSASSTYALIDSTADTSRVNAPPTLPGVRKNYYFYVRANTAAGTLQSTTGGISLFGIIKRDTVKIISAPLTEVQAGVKYTYAVVATSTDSTAKLKYSLSSKPRDMVIDSVTGTIIWAPLTRGWFVIGVRVTSDKKGIAIQKYTLTVSGGNGVVQGSVNDTAGHPLNRVSIQIYQRDKNSHFQYSVLTDSAGHYRISHLDPGNYILHAVSLNPSYIGSWYDGKSNPSEATKIAVADSPAVSTANFVLRHRSVTGPFYTARGSVYDSAGTYIRGSYVVFVRAGFCFNSNNNDSTDTDDFKVYFNNNNSVDWRLEGISSHVFTTRVDSSGHYSLRLPKGAYVAFARAYGYERVFYKSHTDLLSADIIKLKADSSNINFVLTPFPPLALGEISGIVLDSAKNVGVPSRIIAFRDRWYYRDTLLLSRTYFVDTDSLGQYSLPDLLPGNYIVLAVPLGNYVPSFYSVSGPTVRWGKATRISINGNTASGNIIYVLPFSRLTQGYTGIIGNIGGLGPTAPRGFGQPYGTVGIPGTIAYATDSTGTIVGCGVSDGTGNYSISGLAPGTYNISIDKVGYTSTDNFSVSPSYDTQGNALQATASFVLGNPTQVEKSISLPTGYSLEQNYPNPFNPSTQIMFSLPQAQRISLTIFNILGQKVATLVDGELEAGTHVVTWNSMNSLRAQAASGIYFYRIETPSFVSVRKMLLLK